MAELERADALCRLLSIENSLELDTRTRFAPTCEPGGRSRPRGLQVLNPKAVVGGASVWTPDAFLLRQIHDHPRIIANLAGATSTDTIHRVRIVNGTSPIKLAAASVNSATFAFSEVMGRSYGARS